MDGSLLRGSRAAHTPGEEDDEQEAGGGDGGGGGGGRGFTKSPLTPLAVGGWDADLPCCLTEKFD